MLSRIGFGVLALSLLAAPAAAQQTVIPSIATAPLYVPPTTADRVHWVIDGTVSPASIGVTAVDSAWSTRWNWPQEWGRGWKGFGRRFADETASGAISDAIEAGVGTIWGEDPRYRRASSGTTWRRVNHALLATFVAPRRDGHLAPAWGRFGAAAATTGIQNTWLPPSARTPSSMAWRVADDFIWRAVSNVWDEFSPDVRRRLNKSER